MGARRSGAAGEVPGGARLVELDLLRGYAVAMVLCLHLALTDPFRGPAIQAMLDGGELGIGVDVFFVISGYVISRALAPLWDGIDLAAARDVPLRFYQKRFVRLWPAAALWLVLNVALAGLFAGRATWPPFWLVVEKALFGLVYLSDFQEVRDPSSLGYFWSLSVEWQFYLLFPLLLLLVRGDRWRLGVLGAALLLSVGLRPGGAGWRFLRFDGLVFGILVYVLIDRLSLAVPRYRVLEHRLYRPLATLILLAAIIVVPRGFPDARLGFVAGAALAAVLVGMAALDRGYVSTLGLGVPLRWAGSRSYSLYLVHMPVILSVLSAHEMGRAHGRATSQAVNFWYYLVSLAAIAAAAELTFRLVERPSQRASAAMRYAGATKTAPPRAAR